VLCSQCSANVPDGSQFCLKCGQPVSVPTYAAAAPPVTASLGCSKCGASLPDEAQFCLKCGKPVSLPAKSVSGVPGVEVLPPQLPRPKPKRSRGLLFFLLVMLLLGVVVLVATSDHPVAQEIQEMVGWKHDQVILDTPFTVGPHTFRYYKFSLPEGSVNVAIMGQFAAESPNSGAHKKDKEKDKDKDKDVDKDKEKENDGGIEVFVLTDEAFTVWQNGYATSSVYESGKVPTGTVQADLPAGAGVYYLVFSNKLSPKTPKNVQSTVLLRYKSWLPESFRKMKERFMNWTGL
jgi:ribosomal protein L40E